MEFEAMLTDKVTPEDIRPFLGMNEASNVPPAVDIEFPEMETTIHFLHIGGKLRIVFEPDVRATAPPPPNPKGKQKLDFGTLGKCWRGQETMIFHRQEVFIILYFLISGVSQPPKF